MLISNCSIRTKLFLTSVLPVIGLVLLVFIATMQLKAAHDGVDRIYNDRVVPLEDLKIIADNYAILVIDAVNKANAGMITAKAATDGIQKARLEINQKWKVYRARELKASELALAEEAEQLFVTANAAIDQVEKKLIFFGKISEKVPARLNAFDGPLYQDIDPISEKIAELVNLQLREVAKERQQLSDSYQAQRLWLIGLALGIIVILILLSVMVYNSVRKPLDNLRDSMERIVNDADLTAEVHVERNDEIGSMAESFNATVRAMRHLIGQLGNATSTLASAADQLTSVSTRTTQGISAQCLEIEQVASAMNQMVCSAQEVAVQAEGANRDAQKTSEQASGGNQVVDDAVQTTNLLVDEVKEVSERIRALDADSENIGSVVNVITDIAEQTNLLALNAAIEAARAGDQGRGFAVVADEVRTLAQRTRASTEEIRNAIEHLQDGSRQAVSAMLASTSQAEAAGGKAAQAGRVLADIADSVAGIANMNVQIASASEEQTSVAEEINHSLVTINQVSQETDAGAQQIAQSSQALAVLSGELQQLLSKYKV
ncbi:MAG: methyl-accepting chemotaxis protein [Pontibacterium sp.]